MLYVTKGYHIVFSYAAMRCKIFRCSLKPLISIMLKDIVLSSKEAAYNQLVKVIHDIYMAIKVLEKVEYPGATKLVNMLNGLMDVKALVIPGSKTMQEISKLEREIAASEINLKSSGSKVQQAILNNKIARKSKLEIVLQFEKLNYLFSCLRNEFSMIYNLRSHPKSSAYLTSNLLAVLNLLNLMITNSCNISQAMYRTTLMISDTTFSPDTSNTNYFGYIQSFFMWPVNKMYSMSINSGATSGTKFALEPILKSERNYNIISILLEQVVEAFPRDLFTEQEIIDFSYDQETPIEIEFIFNNLNSISNGNHLLQICKNLSNDDMEQLFIDNTIRIFDRIMNMLDKLTPIHNNSVIKDILNLKNEYLSGALSKNNNNRDILQVLVQFIIRIDKIKIDQLPHNSKGLIVFLELFTQPFYTYQLINMIHQTFSDQIKNDIHSNVIKSSYVLFKLSTLSKEIDTFINIHSQEYSNWPKSINFKDFDKSPATVTSGKQVKPVGSGIYVSKIDNISYYFKHTASSRYLADDLAEVLFSDISSQLGFSSLIANCTLVKSSENVIFVASKIEPGFRPIHKPKLSFTARLLYLNESSEFCDAICKQPIVRNQFCDIISICMLLNDVDCNVTNIGYTNNPHKIVKIDHGWAFDKISNPKINIMTENQFFTPSRLKPTNFFIDYLPLYTQEAFLKAMENILRNSNHLLEIDVTTPINHLIYSMSDTLTPNPFSREITDCSRPQKQDLISNPMNYTEVDILLSLRDRFKLNVDYTLPFNELKTAICKNFKTALQERLIGFYFLYLCLFVKKHESDSVKLKNIFKLCTSHIVKLSQSIKLDALSLLDRYLPDYGLYELPKGIALIEEMVTDPEQLNLLLSLKSYCKNANKIGYKPTISAVSPKDIENTLHQISLFVIELIHATITPPNGILLNFNNRRNIDDDANLDQPNGKRAKPNT